MSRIRYASLTLLLITTGNVLAEETTTQPNVVAAATQPASLDPQVENILDRLEKKGEVVKDLQAKIVYVKEDPVIASKHTYKGVLRFKQEQPNPRFFIRFDEYIQDGVVSKNKEWHVFDGENYIEARQKTKTINKHRVVEPGKKAEVFRLGQGPFPLPFGQKKSDIVERFSVKLLPPAKGDPANTDHLECTPLPGTEMHKRYGTIHFYIDRDSDLPVKVSTVEKEEEGSIITAAFTDTKVNTGLAGADLNLPNLKAEGYKEIEDEGKPVARDGAKRDQ